MVNSVTGEPVKRVLVRLQGFRTDSEAGIQTPTIFTDNGGRFMFSSLPQGDYTVVVQKPGFSQDFRMSSQNIHLADSRDQIQLRLAPLATITGKVLDQDKLPVRSLTVVALTERVIGGRAQRFEGSSATTDDRGVYRLSSLNPGDYVIKVTGRTGATSLYAGDSTPLIGLDEEGFRPVYSGGAQKLVSALPIHVDSGSEAHSDLTVAFERAFRIRGSLTKQVPRQTVSFELLTPGEYASPARVTLNGDTGKFEISDVVPGSYILRATQGGTRGEVPVNITHGDVDGLFLPLAAPVDIKVITHFANLPPKQEGLSDLATQMGIVANCMVSLRPTGNTSLRDRDLSSNRNVNGNETLIGGVFPGTYRVETQCFGAYPKTVLSGNNDLLVNPILTLAQEMEPAPIEITALHGGGDIHGTFPEKSVSDADQPWVIAAPRSGPPFATPAFRSDTENGHGDFNFVLPNLAPGDYAVWVVAKGQTTPFREPSFLQSLSPGSSVRVDDNSKNLITLTEVVK